MLQENTTNLQIGPQGRLVIPAAVRRELGLEPGSELIMWVRDGQLILETKDNLQRRLRARYQGWPQDGRISEELIAERRLEAAREAAPRHD
jgi:AbrB family looped-hinge helix DNA binding protein